MIRHSGEERSDDSRIGSWSGWGMKGSGRTSFARMTFLVKPG